GTVPARPKARRGCREEVSLAQCLNIGFVDHRGHNVAQDLHGVLHGADPGALTSLGRSEEHTSELQSLTNLVCRLLLEKKKKTKGVRESGSETGRLAVLVGL